MQEIFNILTISNTIAIAILFYLMVKRKLVDVTETDIIRIISLIGAIIQILKYVIQNPNENIQKRLVFIEELLSVIEKEFEKKYRKNRNKKN